MLRLVRNAPLASAATPRVLGVDDWAMRKGHTYGTILVDLEKHRVVDLSPEGRAKRFQGGSLNIPASRFLLATAPPSMPKPRVKEPHTLSRSQTVGTCSSTYARC